MYNLVNEVQCPYCRSINNHIELVSIFRSREDDDIVYDIHSFSTDSIEITDDYPKKIKYRLRREPAVEITFKCECCFKKHYILYAHHEGIIYVEHNQEALCLTPCVPKKTGK